MLLVIYKVKIGRKWGSFFDIVNIEKSGEVELEDRLKEHYRSENIKVIYKNDVKDNDKTIEMMLTYRMSRASLDSSYTQRCLVKTKYKLTLADFDALGEAILGRSCKELVAVSDINGINTESEDFIIIE